jgi:hypothetical protein
MAVVGVVADIVNVHVDQTPLAGALKNAGFKIWRKNFRQEGKYLKLHGGILPLVSHIWNMCKETFYMAL